MSNTVNPLTSPLSISVSVFSSHFIKYFNAWMLFKLFAAELMLLLSLRLATNIRSDMLDSEIASALSCSWLEGKDGCTALSVTTGDRWRWPYYWLSAVKKAASSFHTRGITQGHHGVKLVICSASHQKASYLWSMMKNLRCCGEISFTIDQQLFPDCALLVKWDPLKNTILSHIHQNYFIIISAVNSFFTKLHPG